MEDLKEFLSYYLPETDLTAFLNCFSPGKVKKNSFYLTPGKVADTISYIQTGCFRVYYHDIKGKEITTWFSFSGMVISDLMAFYTGDRALFYIRALEDGEIYTIHKKDLEALYATYPEYREFGRKFAEEALTMMMQRTLSLHTKTAEERYKELLGQPEFMQRIPLKYLASYLGVTDTSLSRLRRKIK